MKETKYTVKYTTSFKKDYKRAIKRGPRLVLFPGMGVNDEDMLHG